MNRLFSSLAILFILFTPFLSAGDNIKVLKEALLNFEAEVADIELDWVSDSSGVFGKSLAFTSLQGKVLQMEEEGADPELLEYLRKNKEEMIFELDEPEDSDSSTGKKMMKYRQWFGLGVKGKVLLRGKLRAQKIEKPIVIDDNQVENREVFRTLVEFNAYPREEGVELEGDYTIVNSTNLTFPFEGSLIRAQKGLFLKKVHWPIPFPEFSRAYHQFTLNISYVGRPQSENKEDLDMAHDLIESKKHRFKADATSKVWKHSDVYKQVERYLNKSAGDSAVVSGVIHASVFTQRNGEKKLSYSVSVQSVEGPMDVIHSKRYVVDLMVDVHKIPRVVSFNTDLVKVVGLVKGLHFGHSKDQRIKDYVTKMYEGRVFEAKDEVYSEGADAIRKHRVKNGVKGELKIVAELESVHEVYRDGTQGVLDTLSIESAKGSLASWHEYKFEKEYEAFNEKVGSFEELYKNQYFQD